MATNSTEVQTLSEQATKFCDKMLVTPLYIKIPYGRTRYKFGLEESPEDSRGDLILGLYIVKIEGVPLFHARSMKDQIDFEILFYEERSEFTIVKDYWNHFVNRLQYQGPKHAPEEALYRKLIKIISFANNKMSELERSVMIK